MSYQEIISIPPEPADQHALINSLHALWRRWSRTTGSNRIFSLIRRGVSVTEPTSQIHIRRSYRQSRSNDNESITVVSANLWHDWPFHRYQMRRLEAFANLVEQIKADIILLQEVSRTSTIKVDKWLVERLGMSSIYARANGSLKTGFEEGLAVLSRFPLDEPQITHLHPTATPVTRRLALGGRVSTPAGKLWVFSVHLGIHRRLNVAQQYSLRRMITKLPDDQPALLGGDFNSHESSLQIRENNQIWIDTFRYLHPDIDGTTHALRLPWGGSFFRRRLDYIFLREHLPGWEIQEAGHLHAMSHPHSDHHAVYARLAQTSCL